MGNLQESCLYRVNLMNGMIHTLVEGCQQGEKCTCCVKSSFDTVQSFHSSAQ